jgi:hypothetical protein
MLDVTSPESLPLIQQQPTCEHCATPFAPREGSGGKRQRFCSPDCRAAFHANAQHSQRSPTYSKKNVGNEEPAAHPQKSNRAIAEEIGVSLDTVNTARNEVGERYRSPEREGRDGKASLASPEPATADGGWVYTIPRQAEIVCAALKEGGIEIEQECLLGGEPTIIHVAEGNAVALARRILYAAGFQTVLISTHEKGGCVDLDDGDLARNFYRE